MASVNVAWGRGDTRALEKKMEMENRFPQNAGISSVDEKKLASEEGLCSVDFSFMFSTFDSRANEGINIYIYIYVVYVRHFF